MLKTAKNNINRLINKGQGLLVKAQKITGIDNLYFFKGGFWMVIAQIAFILSGIALSVAFTRLGTKALFGKYQLVLAIVATLGITYLPGAANALMQAVSRGAEKTFFPILRQRLKSSLLGSFGLLLTAAYFYFFRGDLPFAIAFIIVAITFPFLFFDSLFNSFFAAKGDFARANYYLIIERILSVVVVCIALFIKPEFITVIFLYYVSLLLINIYNYYKFKRRKFKNLIDKEANKRGFELTLINIIPKLLGQADRLLVSALLGVEALSIYIIAIIIPDTIDGFMSLMHTVAFKKFVNLPEKQIIPKLSKPWVILFFAAIVAATVIGIPFAINLLYGKEYLQSIYLGRLYAIILPIGFVWKTFSNWLLAQKRTKGYFYFTNGFYIVNALIFAIMLWFSRTLEAAIFARIIAATIFAILSFVYIKLDIKNKKR